MTIALSQCRPGTLVEVIASTPELALGSVYTIDRAAFADRTSLDDWGVRLVEVEPPTGWQGFDRSRFRVVPAGRLDVFREMLAPKPMVDA